MRIQIVRLTTGEELIGSFDSEAVVIHEPFLVAVGSNPLSNQMKVQLVPWAMFVSGNSVRLKNEHIMYVEEAEEQLYNRYTQMTGAGIQLPASTGRIQL